MNGPIVTKFDVCLQTKPRCILHRSWVWVGYICTCPSCAHADVPPFPYLGNTWTDCAEIWCVVMGPTAMCFIGITNGVDCTCALAHHFFIPQ